MIEFVLNGQKQQRDAPLSVADLLAELNLSGKRLAVEMNGQIVPKSHHAQCLIEPDCQIEIVVAVGGG